MYPEWKKKHVTAYLLLNAQRLLEERWLDSALKDDSVLQDVDMGVAQDALRQVMLLYKPRTREKHEIYLASVKLLFHRDGKWWTLRQTTSSPPAKNVARPVVVEPSVEPTTMLLDEAQHEEFSDVDHGG